MQVYDFRMNTTTVALLFLLVVVVVAALSRRVIAVAVSLAAFVCFNYFFLQPVGSFSISKGEDLVALVVLLAVSLIASQLAHQSRERAEAAARADAKVALVASLSHDLKSPLTALTVSAGNLEMPGLSDEERREQLRLIQAELARLKRLFDSIIDMASVETHSMTAELEWVHPADIIEAACHQADAALHSRKVEITNMVEGRVVHLDPRITSAALAHVLENAAMYSPQTSPITIEAGLSGDRLVLAVRDRGPGLRGGEADRVFDRSYRGIESASNQFSSGMGLAITRGLVALQNGHVRAENHPEGGALFTISVPAASRPASEAFVPA